jgi:hypothetical protein
MALVEVVCELGVSLMEAGTAALDLIISGKFLNYLAVGN